MNINHIAQWFVNHIAKDQADGDIAVYTYGAETFIYTILSTMSLFSLGALEGRILSTIIIVVVFYLCQHYGGYHARSHLQCFFCMCFGLLVSLWCTSFPLSVTEWFSIGLIACIILLAIPCHLNKEKAYLCGRKPVYVAFSRIQTSILLVLLIILYCIFPDRSTLLTDLAVALTVSAFSRVTGILFCHSNSAL